MHHILDAHELHFFSAGTFHATVPLPVILYSPGKGLSVFMSSKFQHGHAAYNGYVLEHGKIRALDGSKVYDFSITKNVFMMLVGAGLLFWFFISSARQYQANKDRAPKGLQSFLEPLIIFIRDEVAVPILGNKAGRLLPYLLSIFFFIWICNLIGLLPGFAANITGNIAVTLTLACFTFFLTLLSSGKHYWSHIFKPEGVPAWLLPIMWIVEISGIFTKPIALMIRLFANMTAGHMIILSIISLIFIFGQTSPALGYGVGVISTGFALFMFMLELLVAVLQAYIFTILSALFIGEAMADGH